MQYHSLLLTIGIFVLLIGCGMVQGENPVHVTPGISGSFSTTASAPVLPAVNPSRQTSTISSRLDVPGSNIPSVSLPRTGSDVMSRQITPKPTVTASIGNSTTNNSTLIQINRTTQMNGSYVPGELIIKYNRTGSMQSPAIGGISQLISSSVGASLVADLSSPTLPGLQLIKLPGNMSVEEGIRKIEMNPLVEYAEPNYIISLNDPPVAEEISATAVTPKIPSDPSYSLLWGLSSGSDHDIDAPEAWNLSIGSQSVIVAVVDTGVAYNHVDLDANMWRDSEGRYGYDYANMDTDPYDDHGHGTHCAGTIGAVGNNTIGIVGVNWNVRIMAVKFLNSGGSGTTDRAIMAINYANSNGASVISNSWGGGGYSQALKDAIDSSPAVVVCAAGNDYANTASYPAAYDSANIISVAASDLNDNRADFSNYHVSLVDVAAPGVDIYSTMPGGYGYKSGTSMATPHVAGLAALIKARSPSLTNLQIRQIILDSVDKLSQWSGLVATGGRINAYQALILARPPLQAKFYGVPGITVSPYTVQFHDASEGEPTSWTWDFGDNTSSNVKTPPPKEYSTPGSYTVKLTVSRDA